jgi:hypothetical protein
MRQIKRNYDSEREMAAIDRRLARERAYETEILSLKRENKRLRGFLGLVARTLSPDIILADDFHKQAARELGVRAELAAAALRGECLPKESSDHIGFFEGLTEEQKDAALKYDGPENHGDPEFARAP